MGRIAAIIVAAAVAGFSGNALAQQPIDFAQVGIKTIDLGKNTYRLEGAAGNITVAVGTDGIIVVDSQFAPLYDKIKAAITAISPTISWPGTIGKRRSGTISSSTPE